MGIKDVARRIESAINNWNTERKVEAGWEATITGFIGHGTTSSARVLGRVLMRDPEDKGRRAGASFTENAQRGFHQFFTVQVPDIEVTVTLGEATVTARTDYGGYVEVEIPNHGLEAGWQEATISIADGHSTTAEVIVVPDSAKVGIICDIDDTIMVTNLPRALQAAWTSWVQRTDDRVPVAGMSEFIGGIREDFPDAPVFYLSTGAWNTFSFLRDFIDEFKFPVGPMLLTDWGPTQTAMFRSGVEHKRVQLRNLMIDYPDVKWILIGDNGQNDPYVFADVISEHTERIMGVAIRELTAKEHVLSHGTTSSYSIPNTNDTRDVPAFRGADGHELAAQYRSHPLTDAR